MSLELIVSEIFKGYQGDPVLNGCSFSFDRSGIYVLTGRNGSGKSTFLRICTMLEDPDRGEINYFYRGQTLRKDIALRRRITLLLPRIGVFTTTVFNNVAYGLKLRGMNRRDLEGKVYETLDFVGLTQKANQKALTLSSGETQRLGIARALVIEPEILFLDEPTASVDQANTEVIEQIILNMKKDRGSIIVIATHDLAFAEKVADQILLLQNGKISEKMA